MALDGLEARADDGSFQEAVRQALALAAEHTGLDRWALARFGEEDAGATCIAGYHHSAVSGRAGRLPVGQPALRLPVPGFDERPLAVLVGYGDAAADAVQAANPLLSTVVRLLGALLARQLWWTLTARNSAAPAPAAGQRDPVTGLGERRWWEQELAAEEQRCRAYGSRAAVVLLDLRGTTAFNAAYGHAAGDTRLREAAAVLAGEVRRFDRVARVGADEFGILLVETSTDEVEPIADRLREAMRTAGLPSTVAWAVRSTTVPLRAAWAAATARLRAQQAGTGQAPGGEVAEGPGSRPALADDADLAMQQALEQVRRRLGGDVVFVSELAAGRQTLRWVSSPAELTGFRPGASLAAEDGYCARMLDGRLPSVIPDTAANPVTAAMPITGTLGIGSYLGVPLALPGGRQGTLCCVSRASNPTLNQRDAAYLSDAADLITATLGTVSSSQRRRHEVLHRLDALRRAGGPTIVVQPIVELDTGRVAGVEALSRFPAGLGGSPVQWFLDAAEVGEMVALELMALRNAATILPGRQGFVSVNLSPTAVAAPGVVDVLAALPLEQIVLELTEHEQIDDLTDVARTLAPLRQRGMRIAIDDVGAGYAGLTRVAYLHPDILKLDIGLVRGVDRDPVRRALASAFVAFAADCGALVVAEGIETATELMALRDLGAHLGQGWVLSRPVAPDRVPEHIDVP